MEENKQKNFTGEGNNLFEKLNYSLKNDLIVQINGKILTDFSCLMNNFDS